MPTHRLSLICPHIIPLILTLAALLLIDSSYAIEPHESSAWNRQLPKALEDWKSWALWESSSFRCPSEYNNTDFTHCAWPSKLTLDLHDQGGTWQLDVHTFDHTWVTLPGHEAHWPHIVTSGTSLIPVIPHQQDPATYLPPGFHRLKGTFQWKTLPQHIAIPMNVGILDLTLNGKKIDHPEWHPVNILQLHRKAEKAEEEFLETKIYRLIEDGVPMWLHTQVEITVGGKSREVILGHILPEGWKIASVEAPIPAVIDSEGRLKAQVRSGKWIIDVRAFILQPLGQIAFSPYHTPILEDEWIGLQQNPALRVLEIQGLSQVDVTQTSYPQAWRKNPVFHWPVRQPFQLVEKMRGMGDRTAQGLTINRTFWLDENGQAITYRDRVHGHRDNLWRLDAAQDHNLGSVKINGQGQLITRNPANQLHGIEIRDTHLNLEAVGRIPTPQSFPATGWTEDAQNLSASFYIPPGWRVITVFGPDQITGDWFNQWSLFDIFLCILITGAIQKLFGFKAAILALLMLAITYHEPQAPRLLWLIALLPIALKKISPAHARLQAILNGLRWAALALLLLGLLPFVKHQLKLALFPQLEKDISLYAQSDAVSHPMVGRAAPAAMSLEEAPMDSEIAPNIADTEIQQTQNVIEPQQSYSKFSQAYKGKKANLLLNQQIDARARIQTGPGIPEWSWEQIHLRWNGPVSNNQKIELVLIPPTLERIIKILRVALLIILFVLILRGSLPHFHALMLSVLKIKRVAAILILFSFFFPAHSIQAQSHAFPSPELLEKLQERLTHQDPKGLGADLVQAKIELRQRRLILEAEIHAARRAAFPLPLKVDRWSPLSVTLNGRSEVALQRAGCTRGTDRELWIVIPSEGVHQIRLEGIVPENNTWPCRFVMAPKIIQVRAEGWQIAGINEEGRLIDKEITFTRDVQETSQPRSSQQSEDYTHRDYAPALLIERHLDIGLTWKVATTARRLTPATSAIQAHVPLLKNERVLSSDVTIKDNLIEVRLIAGQESYTWESELLPSDNLELRASAQDLWVEQWRLLLSPMWSARFEGIAPIFDTSDEKLSPRWQPWPGENVTLHIARPEAVPGETFTIHRVQNQQKFGLRQRTGKLQFTVESSMGEDFRVSLPPESAITRLERDGTTLPVLRENDRLIFPLTRGRQEIQIEWKNKIPFSSSAQAEKIAFDSVSTNITTTLTLPQNRWILWITGPLRGPAVQFWVVLAVAILIGWVLGQVPRSPLRSHEWILLSIGLTQVHLIAGGILVGWLFLLLWRGTPSFLLLKPWIRNSVQVLLLILTLVALGILFTAIGSGLIGAPQMYIAGNPSYSEAFQWFTDRAETALPQPTIYSASIWWYRGAMLLWALWIASAILRWLKWGWEQFGNGGYIHRQSQISIES